MKWIQLDDMRPPVGMHVIITYGVNIAIVEWEQHHNDNTHQYISFDHDYTGKYKPIYQIDAWAPISFFDKYTDDKYIENKENDWYAQHKDNPLINIIKEMSDEEGTFETRCKISGLFNLISNGKTEYIDRDSEPVSIPFEANLLSIPVPKMVSSLGDMMKSSLSKISSKTLSLRKYPVREYTIHYRNSVTGKVVDENAIIPVKEASQWTEFHIYKDEESKNDRL